MNRRDTIVIAVLLNAGVLAILFMLAVSENIEPPRSFPPVESTIVRSAPVQKPMPPIAVSNDSFEDFTDIDMDESVVSNEEFQATHSERYTFDAKPLALQPSSRPLTKAASNETSLPTREEPFVEVSVKRGDSLDKLARSNGSTIEAIKKANNLRSDVLNIGQVVRIPLGNKGISQKIIEVKKPVDTTSAAAYYTIKSGDSPWKISRQNNINVDELLRLNNLDEEKARNLKVGDRLRIK